MDDELTSSQRPRHRQRICFVAPHAYSVLSGDRRLAMVGGAEVQMVQLARELARRGNQVSMICLDYGQPEGQVIDGITVHRAHAPRAGLPVLRFLHPRLTSIWAAMRRADADIYYQRAAGALTGFVVAFAHRHQRCSVYASASDMDFDPRLPWVPTSRDRALFRWGVRHADAVVVQTPAQRQACLATWKREPVQMNSAYGHCGEAARPDGPIVWVGTVKALKRPELFVELARSFPSRRFRLVGGGTEADMAALRVAAAGLANLELTGFVPFADVEAQFDGAAVLVNTSTSEGFPNTFLQAWSRGMPTLSVFDVGIPAACTVRTPSEMVSALQLLLADETGWRQRSRALRDHFQTHHDIGAVVDRYECLFDRLAFPSASLGLRAREQSGARP